MSASQEQVENAKGKGSTPSLQEAIANVKALEKANISTALEKIEELADSIDVICEVAEKDDDFITEISSSGVIGSLLQVYSSPCQEAMKLALSGLERILTNEDLALVAIESGAFEIFSKVFLDVTEPLYLKMKASAIIVLMLLSDFEKGLKQQCLQNGIFAGHLAMIAPSASNDTHDLIVRFLIAISDDCQEAQEQLMNSAAAISFLLMLIKQRQYQALGPLCNLLQLENLKAKLPVAEIESILTPLLNDSDADIDDVNFDRVVLLLANLIDSEKEDYDTYDILLEQLQDMAFAILDGSLITCSLMQVLSGVSNLAVSDHNKLSIGNSDIPKVLMEVLQREGPLVFANPDDDDGLGSAGDGDDLQEEDRESKNCKVLAARVVWSLAFHESNRKKMEANGTLQTIQRLSTQGDNVKMKRNLEGCLWLFKHPTGNLSGSNAPLPDLQQPTSTETTTADNKNNTSISNNNNTKKESSSQKPMQIEGWTVEEVKQWLSQVGLGQYSAVFAAQRIDGRALAEIARNICHIPFLEIVEKRLEFRLFGDLMGFVHAVRKYV